MIASLGGLLIVFIASKVALLHPKQSFFEYCKLILGKWIGSFIVILYLVQWYSVIGDILGEFAEFSNTILLSRTPSWILVFTMLLLIIYVVFLGGIEGIGRCSEVFGPIILLSMTIIFLLSIPNMEINRILPIYGDTGIMPILKGTIYPISFLGESVFMLMLISFMDKPKQGTSKAVWGFVVAAFLLSMYVMSIIMIFGPEVASKLKFPAFDMIRYINVMNFIQNLEIVAILVWILSIFVKLSLYFFLACYGTAKLFNMKDWKKTIWFVAIFSFIWAQFLIKHSLHGYEYLNIYQNQLCLTY